MTERTISDSFVQDLIDGKLAFFLREVKKENRTCTIEIRQNYINVYYRGGSLVKIQEIDTHEYEFTFDIKYGKRENGLQIIKDGKPLCTEKNGEEIPIQWCSFAVEHYDDIKKWTEVEYEKYFYDIQDMMDGWFKEHPKKEREYQHNASLNNDNCVDVEYAIGEDGMRLDMVMIENGELYLIENKFGNSAISSASKKDNKEKPGLSKHYKDFIKVLTKDNLKDNIVESMKGIIEAKKKLGIMHDDYNIKLINGKPVFHIMFVLADLSLSPNSKIIENEISKIKTMGEDILHKYPSYVLCTKANEYKLDFNKSVNLLEFRL